MKAPVPNERDDLPIFRPRFRKGPKTEAGGAAFRNAVLARMRGLTAAARRRGARARIAVRPSLAQARRVIVKARYVKLAGDAAAAAALHLRYIQRDGVERGGRKGVLYGEHGDVSSLAFEEPRLGERHQFRLIVSPEDAEALDLTDYVRRLMAQVEKDLGRRLEWAAVNHFNTEHPHAHLVIRGVDRDGRALRFDRDYISRGLRDRAQELATRELGPRTEFEIRRARGREVTQERFTSLDRVIARRAEGGEFSLSAQSSGGRSPVSEATLLARLEHLERMRLADRMSPNSWTLAADWTKQLRDLGARGDIVHQMHAALRGDPARYRVVPRGEPLAGSELSPGKPAPPVYGRIRAKGLADELGGAFYAVIETPDGAGYHVALDRRSAEACREGDFVEVATKPRSRVRPEDHAIEALAARAGRVFTPTPSASASPSSPELLRRLRELEALGLAHAEPSGRWTIPQPLIAALQDLDARDPQVRLLVRPDRRSLEDQVTQNAPVWLDGVDRRRLAPHGLGAELREVLERREHTLRSMGIDPADPRRLFKLGELERRAVGERIAARRGSVFVGTPPDGFRGHVEVVAEHPRYLLVTDGPRLALVTSSRDLRQQVGQTVTFTRDEAGKIRMRPVDLERGR